MAQPNLNTFAPKNSSKETGAHILPTFAAGARIVVTGAGAFGSWTALYLLRNGFNVTLVDSWGPGNARSSSSDETRVIRSTYGANEIYFDLNVNALSLWKENQKRFGKQLFFNTGVLWFCYEESTPLVDDSIPFAKKHKMEYEYLTNANLKRRHPQINVEDLHHAYFDPFGGYLKARESVQLVVEAFQKEGGTFIQSDVKPGKIQRSNLSNVTLPNGNHLQADAFVFACGSWLSKIFPDLLEGVISCTKQEVYYFGVPSAGALDFESIPVWVDVDGRDFYYGIPGNAHRGFKIGVDIRGPEFDPTSGDRVYTPNSLAKARAFIAHRFPDLANAPLTESRVCPYENSPDGNFIFDLIPETENAFLLGGGSGHGFKHGPALGSLVAKALSGQEKIPPLFLLPQKRS
ncbi:MAG TPA: FAD-dependent oxidoreductase [Chryseolinea sp.]